jgi:hypothetical protein
MRTLGVTAVLVAMMSAVPAPYLAQGAGAGRARIYSDHAHGTAPLPPEYASVAAKLGAEVVAHQTPITADALKGFRLVVLRAPQKEITAAERTALIDFVKQGGSLLLVVDEEVRTSLAATHANELIAPFGMTLTADVPYLHNNGALAKKGTINTADRELPFSGGRAIEGGNAFAWQLDKDGKPAQPFAASTVLGSKGRVVVMAEAMASLFMGTADGVRLTGVPRDPSKTTYWGKDSAVFMEELLTWLIG